MLTSASEIGFMTKTDLEGGTIKIFLLEPLDTIIDYSAKEDRRISQARKTISIDDFVNMLNFLPPQIAERITGCKYRQKKIGRLK